MLPHSLSFSCTFVYPHLTNLFMLSSWREIVKPEEVHFNVNYVSCFIFFKYDNEPFFWLQNNGTVNISSMLLLCYCSFNISCFYPLIVMIEGTKMLICFRLFELSALNLRNVEHLHVMLNNFTCVIIILIAFCQIAFQKYIYSKFAKWSSKFKLDDTSFWNRNVTGISFKGWARTD